MEGGLSSKQLGSDQVEGRRKARVTYWFGQTLSVGVSFLALDPRRGQLNKAAPYRFQLVLRES